MTNETHPGGYQEAALDRIAQERAIWDALVAEVDPAWADEPNAIGEWSFKDVVAHLAGWRQLFVDALVAAVQGTPIAPQPWPFAFSWSEEGTPEGEARAQAINEWLAEQGRSRSYAQVLAQTSLQWTTMAAVVDLMPDDMIASRDALPGMDGVSVADAIVGPGAFGHFHEEHEPDIRAWLAGKQR